MVFLRRRCHRRTVWFIGSNSFEIGTPDLSFAALGFPHWNRFPGGRSRNSEGKREKEEEEVGIAGLFYVNCHYCF